MRNWILTIALLALSQSCTQNCSDQAFEIRLLGDEHRWFVTYPGPDGILGTPDDIRGMRDIYLPKCRPITIHMESNDYIYTFKVEALSLKRMAVPDVAFELEFSSDRVGSFDIDGGQMCGLPAFGALDGTMRVQEGSEFDESMARLAENPPTEETSAPET